MKKLLKFSLALAVVLTTAGTYANVTDFSLLVKKEEGKTINFSMNSKEKMELSLYDSNNMMIHNETIDGATERTYNLEALPPGLYFLKADSATKTANYEVTVTDTTARIASKAKAEVYKPTLVSKDGIVTLSILNFNESPVAVTIYDTDGVELYEGSFSSAVHFFKKFDVSKVPASQYVFEINYNNTTFSQTVATR